jgi:hypothetical protein
MFICMTIITLVAIFIAGGPQGKPVDASYTLFLPSWWLALLIYILWGVTLLYSCINPMKRFTVLQYISGVGAHANMQALNVILLSGACLFVFVGGGIANANMLVAGIIVVLGLIGNAWEQRSII